MTKSIISREFKLAAVEKLSSKEEKKGSSESGENQGQKSYVRRARQLRSFPRPTRRLQVNSVELQVPLLPHQSRHL